MSTDEKGLTAQELGAYGVGISVTVVSAILTGPVMPIPLNLMVSFGLGGTAWYAARKLLDPWTEAEKEERRTAHDYKAMLGEMTGIANRTLEASKRWYVGAETSGRLASVARTIEMILERQRNQRDFAGASKTLIVLQKFDGVLAHYVRVKSDELFIDQSQAEQEIAETEGHIIPMVGEALEELGRKMDSGESIDTDIHKGTLEDMLRSLDLIRSLKDEKGSRVEGGFK